MIFNMMYMVLIREQPYLCQNFSVLHMFNDKIFTWFIDVLTFY